jgi:lipopolysaccharide transport system ATP-binding protein
MSSAATPTEYAIETRGLGKAYRLYRSPARRLAEWASFGAFRGHDVHWGLRGLDVRVPHARTLGVIGGNGSGKSTLLRVLAGASAPTEGAYRINGRVSSLLDLGSGFHPGATGRENVLGSAFLWGFRRDEIRARLPEIIEYSELGAAIDDPVRTYSSGMAMRLGFALSTACLPDVLLLDEVFAVGDLAFQKKCIDRIFELKRGGRSIVFVSHSLYDVRLLCDEVLWLDRGNVRALGEPLAVTDAYQASLERRRANGADGRPGAPAEPDRPRLVRIDVHCSDEGRRAETTSEASAHEVWTGANVEIRVEWANPTARPIHLGIGFLREDTVLAFGVATYAEGPPLVGARGRTTLALPGLALLPGRYLVAVWLLDEHGVHRYHEWPGTPITVRGATREYGLYAPPRAWRHETLGSDATLDSDTAATPREDAR